MSPHALLALAAAAGLGLYAATSSTPARRLNLEGRQYRIYDQARGKKIVLEHDGKDAISASYQKSDGGGGTTNVYFAPWLQEEPTLAKWLEVQFAIDLIRYSDDFGIPKPMTGPSLSELEQMLEDLKPMSISGSEGLRMYGSHDGLLELTGHKPRLRNWRPRHTPRPPQNYSVKFRPDYDDEDDLDPWEP
jgi:hypothetical protein